jgi:D-lyxose ketol-isomerase
MGEMNFKLPPWASWSPGEWSSKGEACDEMRRCCMGWDLTDFGSGNFAKTGLLLFTLRNGRLADGAGGKPYAEKIMIAQDGQVTPWHFHWHKKEDIINRGGGDLVISVNMAAPGDDASFDLKPFQVSIDGVKRKCRPGDVIRLKPGESVYLEPRLYHSFRAEGGKCLVGEVSSVNEDATDNRFHALCPRFPVVDEDEAARYLLCTEYSK